MSFKSLQQLNSNSVQVSEDNKTTVQMITLNNFQYIVEMVLDLSFYDTCPYRECRYRMIYYLYEIEFQLVLFTRDKSLMN